MNGILLLSQYNRLIEAGFERWAHWCELESVSLA
jgi:hypothetical protein